MMTANDFYWRGNLWMEHFDSVRCGDFAIECVGVGLRRRWRFDTQAAALDRATEAIAHAVSSTWYGQSEKATLKSLDGETYKGEIRSVTVKETKPEVFIAQQAMAVDVALVTEPFGTARAIVDAQSPRVVWPSDLVSIDADHHLRVAVDGDTLVGHVIAAHMQCPFHSRAMGARCDLVHGHDGLCSSAGDGFVPGFVPAGVL